MKIDQLATVVLSVAALAIAVVVVRREFLPAASTSVAGFELAEPTYVSKWREFSKVGIRIGDSTARIQVVEFADLECPYCKKFHESYKAAIKEYGNDISLVFVHWPIQSHRFARPAGRAVECAREQGRFGEYLNISFSKQDSLGLKSWSSYAAEAGVPDSSKFIRCASSTGPVAAIDAGLAVGEELGVSATPTIIINGWRLSRVPYDSLNRVIRESLTRQLPSHAAAN